MKSKKAVSVFNGAFFTRGVGVGVVEIATDDRLDFLHVEEFATVISEKGFHRGNAARLKQIAEGSVNALLGEAREFDADVVTGLSLNENEETTAFSGSRMDGVHFPVAELLAQFPCLVFWDVVDEVPFFTSLCDYAL